MSPPIWLIAAILIGLVSNLFNFLNRYLLKDGDDSTAFAWYNEVVFVIIFALIAVLDWRLIITGKSIVLFALLGLSEFFARYWHVKMHKYSHLSISTILSRTRLIWVPILAFLFAGEVLHEFDYFGIVIVFLGVSLAVAPKKLFIDKGTRYANLSALAIAINVVLIKMIIPFASPGVITLLMVLPSVILFPLLMKNSKSRIKTLFKTKIGLKTFTACLGAFQLIIFTIILKFGEASKINAVYQGMLIFSVLAGIIFLRERENIGRKLIGATITIVGVVLLSFF